MKYQVIIPRSVQKMLDALPQVEVRKIVQQLSNLQENPRPARSKKLRGKDGWRIRVGDYRVVYTVIDDNKVVLLTKIGHRKEVYR